MSASVILFLIAVALMVYMCLTNKVISDDRPEGYAFGFLVLVAFVALFYTIF